MRAGRQPNALAPELGRVGRARLLLSQTVVCDNSPPAAALPFRAGVRVPTRFLRNTQEGAFITRGGAATRPHWSSCGNTLQGLSSSPRGAPEPASGRRETGGGGRLARFCQEPNARSGRTVQQHGTRWVPWSVSVRKYPEARIPWTGRRPQRGEWALASRASAVPPPPHRRNRIRIHSPQSARGSRSWGARPLAQPARPPLPSRPGPGPAWNGSGQRAANRDECPPWVQERHLGGSPPVPRAPWIRPAEPLPFRTDLVGTLENAAPDDAPPPAPETPGPVRRRACSAAAAGLPLPITICNYRP